MKVSIIGSVGLPACYGGWETLVENLVKYRREDISYTIYCSSKSYSKRPKSHNGAKLIYIPLHANGKWSVLYDIISMIHTWFTRPDVILILGVSGCVFLPIYHFFSRSKIIVNVDGLESKRDKWNKIARIFLRLSERIAVRHADVVVSDNEGVSTYIWAQYRIRSKNIAYGGEHALVVYDGDRRDRTEDFFFTVCRIEPENNIDLILNAFSGSKYHYKIVGNWDSSAYGVHLKEKYERYSNIEMLNPIYDLVCLSKYRTLCCGYIHGHSVGGTNPSLVEIMHFGKQVYAYDCSFNRLTTENRALYFKSTLELITLVKNNYRKIQNLELKEIAQRRYVWSVVTDQYQKLYKM